MDVRETPDDSEARESLLGRVGEEYFSAIERGERPSLSNYAERYPEIAEDILAVFPALALVGNSMDPATLNSPPPVERPLKELGDYQLIREIGRGGMGIVYEAEQLSLGRRVAVKVLPLAGMLDERQLQRFKNEARAAATLHHPHIVPVYSVGCERGVHYYAMQLIEGQSLAGVIAFKRSRERGTNESVASADNRCTEELLQSTGDLKASRSSSMKADFQAVAVTRRGSVETASLENSSTLPDVRLRDYFFTVARLGIEAAEALGHAHEHGIIHRDVKPENLLLDNAGKLWITDLGLAQFESEIGLTRTGDVVGTLSYMSPEQALGQGMIDQRTDVYSLGATLYELATLQPPFPGADRKELMHKIAFQEPIRPRLVNRDLPIDLDTIICKAMKKDVADRYVNATELAKDLRRFVELQPILARPASLVERLGKWSRRHVAIVWTLLAAALMGIVLLMVSIALISRSRSGMQAALHEAAVNQQRLSESLYAADIRLADQSWREQDPLRAVELLDQHVPKAGHKDLRDLEWHYLRTRCSPPSRELVRIGAPIYDFAFSPNGDRLALAGQDAALYLYEWPSMRLVECIPTDQGEVNGVTFSGDGETVATVGDNGELRLWTDFEAPTHRTIPAHKGRAFDVIYSKRKNCWVTCGEDGAVKLFDQETGKLLGVWPGHPGGASALELSSDGATLASTGRDAYVRLWDLDLGREINSIHRYGDRNTTMAFDAHDEVIIVGGVADAAGMSLIRFNLKNKESTPIKFSAHKVSGIVVSPDSRSLTIASDGGVISQFSMDAETLRVTGNPIRSWLSHKGELHKIAYTPDGSRLLTAGNDGVLRAWSETTHEGRVKWWSPTPQVSAIDSIGALPLVAIAGLNTLSIADVETGNLVTEVATGDYDFVDASPDGSLIAARTKTHRISVWAREAEGCIFKATLKPPYKSSRIQLSPNNSLVAVWNTIENNGLHLVDWDTGEERSGLLVHGCRRFDWSPNGDFFVAAENASDDVIVFDALTCQERWRHSRHASSIESLVVSDNSQLIASADDNRLVCVWDAKTGEERWSTILGAAGEEWSYPVSMQFSPAGHTLFSLEHNGQITAWNVATGREMLRMDDPGHSGLCLTICCDGRYICTSKGNRLRVIDMGWEK